MNDYFTINKTSGLSPFQSTLTYLGASTVQIILDNPITSYYLLIQQYAKDKQGNLVSPTDTKKTVNNMFIRNPVNVAMSGLKPRLVSVLFKRVPRFSILVGYDYLNGGSGQPGVAAVVAASLLTTPFLNPIKMIEKQQRISLKKTGEQQDIREIIRNVV